jgi:hypothetical protein
VALRQALDSLLELMLDAGVTVRECSYLLRERAVLIAAKRVGRRSGRVSKSRIAIMTGLTRSEVGRIYNMPKVAEKDRSGLHPARRVLAAWFDNPRFLSADGNPAVLPVFGKRRSFESLVRTHGGGIPVRAMLDELTQIKALDQLPDQRVKAKSRVPISVGLSADAIEAIGERCSDLVQTLTKNLRGADPPLFEATSVIIDADPALLPLIRREIAEQGESFVNGASALLRRSQRKPGRALSAAGTRRRVGVTVYYFDDGTENRGLAQGSVNDPGRRTNLRRRKPPLRKEAGRKPRLSHDS